MTEKEINMSLTFTTSTPQQLLTSFKKAIDDKHVVTWSYDKEGDFTHTPDQWAKKAWMRPVVLNGQLIFKIVAPEGKAVSWGVYGVYHGRLAESFIDHLHDKFETAVASARPTSVDVL